LEALLRDVEGGLAAKAWGVDWWWLDWLFDMDAGQAWGFVGGLGDGQPLYHGITSVTGGRWKRRSLTAGRRHVETSWREDRRLRSAQAMLLLRRSGNALRSSLEPLFELLQRT
jgi:hypothetical protein